MVHIPFFNGVLPTKPAGDDGDRESLDSYVSRNLSAGTHSIESINTQEIKELVEGKSRGKLLRENIYGFLNNPKHSPRAFVWAITLNILIGISVIQFCIETVATVSDHELWGYLEYVIITVFTLELGARFITCPSRVAFFKSLMNWVDFGSLFPFFIEHIIRATITSQDNGRLGALSVVKAVRLMRCLRLFKLGKNSEKFNMIGKALRNSTDGIVLLIMLLVFCNVIFASLIYYTETAYCQLHDDKVWRDPQGVETKFQSIIASMWWSMLTITTVGYGDIVPRSDPGKMIATLCMTVGILLLSFPITILGHAFAEVYAQTKAEKLKEAQAMRLNTTLERSMAQEKEGDGDSLQSDNYITTRDFERKIQGVLMDNHNTIEKLQTSLRQANEELESLRKSEVMILQMTRQLMMSHERERTILVQTIDKRTSVRYSKRSMQHTGVKAKVSDMVKQAFSEREKGGGSEDVEPIDPEAPYDRKRTNSILRRAAKISPADVTPDASDTEIDDTKDMAPETEPMEGNIKTVMEGNATMRAELL